MGKKSFQNKPPRIPFPFEGIQVNGCRNPTCENFLTLSPIKNIDGCEGGIPEAFQRGGGSYRLSGRGKAKASLICEICSKKKALGEDVNAVSTALKSNQAVHEELSRISSHLDPKSIICPNSKCSSNMDKKPISVKKNGKTTSGNQRYICLHCRKSFCGKPKARKHSKPHLNRLLFKLLVNKQPINRIADVLDISEKTVYDKIRFIHRQCYVPDSSENIDQTKSLPNRGALVHNEYTMLAHFFLLKRFFRSTGKTRFFLDLDSGMKTAYISAFREEIGEGRSDGFLVRASKNKTNDEKEKLVANFKRMVSKMSGTPVKQLTFKILMDVTNGIIAERLKKPIKVPNSPEFWIEHPWVSKAEPEKMVAAVTNVSRYDILHQANLYRMVPLAPVDRFFMNIRRMSMYFERPFQSGTGMGRIWHGYSAYNPEMYTIVGDIFRIHYNYCTRSKKKDTPAMKLGLAKAPVTVEKIIYYNRYAG
ncbi:hypothetical protein SAMN04488490_0612 [Marinobacter sp. LV10R510-11A]|uniref:IS1/IS1595 family N-terminal zinc-binding domain-containing protein n=1 Tax=Marinobacter sp. LV10R510-11A TaxID=1415568 RepID=UPI000BB91562|nr:hypothetical protein [Marinobacter sp. LV10R510-11A]SOB75057.1 hypothetical protein SAMN04488490_0612 [Marinobacter sp. LV10R510-11A]